MADVNRTPPASERSRPPRPPDAGASPAGCRSDADGRGADGSRPPGGARPPRPRADTPAGRDRAQLIIVTGLAIGVTLIALVVILNTVIYTENLATRSAGVGGQQAVQYRSAAVETAGEVLDQENREDYDSWAKARANVTHGVSRADRFLRLQHVERETAAEVTAVSADEGTLIRQTNRDRNFTSVTPTNAASWTLVTTVDGDDLRAFDLTVDQSSLDAAPAATTPSTAFNVTATDSLGNEWRLSVYSGGGDVRLAVHNGTQPGVSTLVCGSPHSGGRLRIDLTAGTVNGTDCRAIQFARGLTMPYSVSFAGADRAAGGYNVTVNVTGATGATVQTLNFAGSPGPEPYTVPAAYSLRFDVHYQQPRLTYHDRVRVAPGEPS